MPYHQTTLGSFLFHAKQHLNSAIDDDTISGVNDAQQADISALVSRLRHPSRRYEIDRLLDVLPRGFESHSTLTAVAAMLEVDTEVNPFVVGHALYLVEKQREDQSAAIHALARRSN